MKHDSSGEEKGGYSDDETLDVDAANTTTINLKTPMLTLGEHTGKLNYKCTYIHVGTLMYIIHTK